MSAPSFIAHQLRRLGRLALDLERVGARRRGLRLQGTIRFWLRTSLLCAGSLAVTALFLRALPALHFAGVQDGRMTIDIEQPELARRFASFEATGPVKTHSLFVRNGETMTSLFARLTVSDSQAERWIRAHPTATPIVNPRPGQFVTAGTLPDGRLAYLRLYMEGPHPQDNRTVEMTRYGNELNLNVLPFTFDAEETYLSGTVSNNLADTVKRLKLSEYVLDQLNTVWEGAVNPIRDLKAGDTLRLVYEKRFADGRFVRDGRLLAVQVVSDENVYEAFRFDVKGVSSFYTLNGQSSQQTFMRIPLDVKDVSSEFSPLRRHPITGVIRPHNGTDLRAPRGSRVFAASDGRVTFVGYEARGYGNYVKIDHGLGRTTLYAHLQKVQKGIKRGVRVEKGQIIGYVGTTGLSTGPHLHYELMFDGVQINPKTADLPDTENLSDYGLAQLRATAEPIQAEFDRLAREEGRSVPSELRQRAKQKRREEDARDAIAPTPDTIEENAP